MRGEATMVCPKCGNAAFQEKELLGGKKIMYCSACGYQQAI